MTVSWSRQAGCYVWVCIYGCSDFDYESEAEAEAAGLLHVCRRDS